MNIDKLTMTKQERFSIRVLNNKLSDLNFQWHFKNEQIQKCRFDIMARLWKGRQLTIVKNNLKKYLKLRTKIKKYTDDLDLAIGQLNHMKP